MIEIVSATRLSESEFPASPLGISLARVQKDPRIKPRIAFENSAGLPEVYNRRIEATEPAEILVFVHDDVWIEDFYFSDRVIAALKDFDAVGLAGNRRRTPGQRFWTRSIEDRKADPFLAGAIAHGDAPMGKVGFFGPIIAEVELLDGVFLAARKSQLRKHGVRFDPRFDFHFYDLDFCRTARTKGLRLGTFPLSVTHRSMGGGYRSESWQANADRYFAKWGD
jgi:GT2 family glycosyltransferase